MALDGQIAILLGQVNSLPPMSEGTPELARENFRRMTGVATVMKPPPDVGEAIDIEVDGGTGRLPARLYRPPGADAPVPTLVFFHGGGFVIGDIASYDAQCRYLCAGAHVAVLSVEYRLAPEAQFPAAIEDAVTSTRWALAHADELGGDPDRIVVGGDSAGGNLAAVAAQQLRSETPGLAAQLLIYPVTDFDSERPSHTANGEGLLLTSDDMDWFRLHYLGDADRTDPRASPLLSGDLAGLPPALVVTAEFDPLIDDGDAYADALEAAGVRVVRSHFDGLIHGFLGLGPFSGAAASAIDSFCRDFRELLAEATIRA